MVEFYERPLIKTISIAEGRTQHIDIPKDRFIQEIILRLRGTVDTGAAAPVLHEDNPFSIIRQIRVVANGNDILRAISGANLAYLNWFDFHGTLGERVRTPTATGQADVAFSCSLTLPFKLDPRNVFDVGALLPAIHFSTLDLFVDWGVVADLATNTSDLKGEMSVNLREAELTEGEAAELWGDDWAGLVKQYLTETVKTVDAAYNEFKFEVDLPTGMILRRSMIRATLNAVRSDNLIPKFKVSQESPVKRDLLERLWHESQLQDRNEYRVSAPLEGDRTVRGMTILDYEKLPAIDATQLKKGDIKFKANTIAPTGTTNVTLITEEVI